MSTTPTPATPAPDNAGILAGRVRRAREREVRDAEVVASFRERAARATAEGSDALAATCTSAADDVERAAAERAALALATLAGRHGEALAAVIERVVMEADLSEHEGTEADYASDAAEDFYRAYGVVATVEPPAPSPVDRARALAVLGLTEEAVARLDVLTDAVGEEGAPPNSALDAWEMWQARAEDMADALAPMLAGERAPVPTVGRFLDLSTGHVGPDELDEARACDGAPRVIAHEYGAWVHVQHGDDGADVEALRAGGCPNLARVVEYAASLGRDVVWVNLDADGEVVEGLPHQQW